MWDTMRYRDTINERRYASYWNAFLLCYNLHPGVLLISFNCSHESVPQSLICFVGLWYLRDSKRHHNIPPPDIGIHLWSHHNTLKC